MLFKKQITYPPSTNLSPLKIGRIPKKGNNRLSNHPLSWCKLLVYQSVYQDFLLQNFELDPVIRLFENTPSTSPGTTHPTKVPPTKVITFEEKNDFPNFPRWREMLYIVPWSLTTKISEDSQIYPHRNQATGNLQVVALPKHSANPGPRNQGPKMAINTSPVFGGFKPHSKNKTSTKMVIIFPGYRMKIWILSNQAPFCTLQKVPGSVNRLCDDLFWS